MANKSATYQSLTIILWIGNDIQHNLNEHLDGNGHGGTAVIVNSNSITRRFHQHIPAPKQNKNTMYSDILSGRQQPTDLDSPFQILSILKNELINLIAPSVLLIEQLTRLLSYNGP
jgi:hypothetical protein